MTRMLRAMGAAILCCLVCLSANAQATRAEGFEKLPPASKVAVMPLDIELFSVSAGGILEPQAEWTASAQEHMLRAFREKLFPNVEFTPLPESDDEAIVALNHLHGAVGNAIALHHAGPFKLPTKEGKLDWSLGDSVGVLKDRTGARYALFTFVRDSYASSERKAAMFVAALLGVGLGGGVQVGYASLVDLETGNIVWFNRLIRATGDLREYDRARESMEALLDKFPS